MPSCVGEEASHPVLVTLCLTLDQPDLEVLSRSRRLHFGDEGGGRISILNGRARDFEGGTPSTDLSLKWMASGSAAYESGGRSYRLKGDNHLLLNPGEPYRLRFLGASESFTVSFSHALSVSAWGGKASVLPEFPTVAGRSPAQLGAHLSQLREESLEHDPDGERLIEISMALLGEIAALARIRCRQESRIRAARRATREELLRRLARAEDYLLGARGKLTLEAAASAAALSPFHLIAVFRAVHGETPLAFAARARLETARDALMLTNDPIETIARRAGYESRTAFDRAFRRRFGTTPGALRN